MKHPNTLSRNKTGLLIIDMQEKFAPAVPRFAAVAQNITRLALTFQMFKMPILVTEQYSKGLGPTVEAVRRLFPAFSAIEKLEFSCTEEPQFITRLHQLGLEALVICGVETHVCINQTTLGLLQRGYRVHVVADAVASRQDFDHAVALKKMEKSGAIISSTEICMFELAGKAGTEEFKNIQRMVKAAPKKETPPSSMTDTGKVTAAQLTPAVKPGEPPVVSRPATGMFAKMAAAASSDTRKIGKDVMGETAEIKTDRPIPGPSVTADTVELKPRGSKAAEEKKPAKEDDLEDALDTKMLRVTPKSATGKKGSTPDVEELSPAASAEKDEEIDLKEIENMLAEENKEGDDLIVT
jgi:nicotinamidase-related amidase